MERALTSDCPVLPFIHHLQKHIDFYTNLLGMKLLRSRDIPEEKYSNAFLAYGPETTNFALELTCVAGSQPSRAMRALCTGGLSLQLSRCLCRPCGADHSAAAAKTDAHAQTGVPQARGRAQRAAVTRWASAIAYCFHAPPPACALALLLYCHPADTTMG